MPTLPPLPAPTPQGFQDAFAVADQAIRRERRPLPRHDLNGCSYRKWAAAVLQAELKHARDDFWSCAHRLGAGLAFDRNDRDGEAAPFRFPHERLAGTAALWLLHLQTHDSDRHGVWSRWTVMTGAERIAWARRRRELLHGFLRACRHYQAARAAIDQPVCAKEAA